MAREYTFIDIMKDLRFLGVQCQVTQAQGLSAKTNRLTD